MITTIAVLLLSGAFQPTSGSPGTQARQQSLLQQIVPQPTGRNGYEEYLMACDIMRSSGAANLTEGTPERFDQVIREYEAPLPKGVSEEELENTKLERPSVQQYNLAKKYRNYSVLQLKKEALNLAGKALDLLNRGNQKPVFDPRTNPDAATLFPEYSQMRALGRLAVAGAYVALAEGRSKQATQYLCDSLILGQNLSDSVLIARLVGISIQAITLAAFEKFLPNLSSVDAQMLEALAPKLVTNPPAATQSIRREFEFMDRSLASMFDDMTEPNGMFGNSEEYSATEKSAAAFIEKMTPAQKQQVVQICRRNLVRQREVVLATYKKPESTWDEPIDDGIAEFPETRSIQSAADLAEYISAMYSPVFSQVGSAEIKNRTQIRLLALAGSVIRFRWENDRWPSKLAEAVGEKGIYDPASNDEFQFEIQGTGFRVYSKGSKSTGEIALRYRRQTTSDNQVPPP